MPLASDADISRAIDDVLDQDASITVADLAAALTARGLDLGEDPTTVLEASMVRRQGRVLDQLAQVYNLHLDEAGAVADFLAHYLHEAALVSAGAPPEPIEPDAQWVQALVLFAPPAVAEAAELELFAGWTEAKHSPVDFLTRVVAAAPRGARANLTWILAKSHERMAGTEAAEAAFETAQSLDPDCWLALFDLARYASDRGDAERALTLLRRAEVPADDPHVTLLTSFRVPERNLGRNDPCWCGSGRKYKACHLGNEHLSLAQRAPWLFHKASVYLNQEDWQVQAHDLGRILAGPDADESAVADEAWSPMVIGSLLFEDRALETFLTERGMLLPSDEYAMAQAWLEAQRSVYSVVSTSPEGITVRDLASGQELSVWDPHAGAHLPVGFVLCARWLPVGSDLIGFGGYEPLADGEADTFLTALAGIDNAADWLSFVAARRAEESPAE